MKLVFFDCQLFSASSTDCPCEDWHRDGSVTELEASFRAVRSGGPGPVRAAVVELLALVLEGLGRRRND